MSACSRWHSGGAFAGYMTLAAADEVLVPPLNNESLCVLLTNQSNMAPSTATSGPKCTPAGLMAGDYCSGPNGTIGQPCANGDSVWLAAQFAASAVNVTTGDAGVELCNGGSVGG